MRFCLPAIRAAHPQAEIVLLVQAGAEPVLRDQQGVDRLVSSHLYEPRCGGLWRRRWMKAREAVRLLRDLGGGYDLALVVGWGTALLDLLGWIAGRRVVGHEHNLKWLLSGDVGPVDFDLPVERLCLEVLAAAGIAAEANGAVQLYAEADAAAVRGILAREGVSRPYAVLHAGSDWACQQWLPERWAAFADRLAEEHGLDLVFTGVAAEQEAVQSIRAAMHVRSVSLCGRTTLAELQALLSGARLCVCVDSVAHDLALAIGARPVVLSGATDTWRPGGAPPLVVDKTRTRLKSAIAACKGRKMLDRGCLDCTCPMSGLRDLDVDSAIECAALALAGGSPQRML
jgi:ADP-heptose:LPS heptosyltransferase